MRPDLRRALLTLAPGVALALWLAGGALALWATLDPGGRAALEAAAGAVAAPQALLATLWWLVAATLAGWTAGRLYDATVTAPARLADATRVLAGDASAPDLAASGPAQTRALAEAINRLAGERRTLVVQMARLVDEAGRDVERQRDQLAALMAELNQSVVVCALDGRILLYNERARLLFRRLSRRTGGADGAERIGLGRSIHDVIDRARIDHALETLQRRAGGAQDQASAGFVTTSQAGHLIRVNLAPVRPAADPAAPLAGYVLLLEDITDIYAADSRRDRQTLELAEGFRASLASQCAALDVLDYPDLDAEAGARFRDVVRDEARAMSERLAAFAAGASRDLMTRWPLEDMLGADLLAAAQRKIEAAHSLPVALDVGDAALWLSVDSFALIRALDFLAARLVERAGPLPFRLRLARSNGRARLDLAWPGDAASPALAAAWPDAPMEDAEGAAPLSVREVVARHDGELWISHDPDEGLAFIRMLLPLAATEPEAGAPKPGPGTSRPEYYDFDLFMAGASSRELDERPLAELAYTVIDTETTGLNPALDEIVQIGATRIVNGRLLRGECLDQLVDPGRSIPEASTAIHGIRPADVRGKPTVAEALPTLRVFVGDTVLVGHNVAFDLSFLRRHAEAGGPRFDMPVLDTLLLSTVVHPSEDLHGLETIAARLGVAPSGRHTALGDALATAEVLLRLLPLLAQRGVMTLGQAREASRRSYYARLRY